MLPDTDISFTTKHFCADTPEEEVARFVNGIRRHPEYRELLVKLLPERHPLYKNRGVNQVNRIRGYILASFEQVGLPKSALIYVLQELENSLDAYTVAASAKALKGMKKPTTQVVPFLLKAVSNIRDMDNAITFEVYYANEIIQNYTTGLKEVFLTLRWLGAYAKDAVVLLEQMYAGKFYYVGSEFKAEILKTITAINNDERAVDTSCCNLNTATTFTINKKQLSFTPFSIPKVKLEDQNGVTVAFDQYFRDDFSVVVFFYTRCNNPNKCSLTITKLVQLRKALTIAGLDKFLKTVAITYDPGYDIPVRLKAYGDNRGFLFDEKNRFFRTESENCEELKQFFELGVNYSGSIVNQHRIELFLLDKQGKPVHSFTHLQWEVKDVITVIKQVVGNAGSLKKNKQHLRNSIAATSKNLWSVLPAVVIAFFPKCPVCWAAYLSLFGIAGLNSLPYSPWLLPVFYCTMGINLFTLFLYAKRRNGYSPFYISLAGALFLLVMGLTFKIKSGLYIGIFLVFVGSVLNSLSFTAYLKLAERFRLNYKV